MKDVISQFVYTFSGEAIIKIYLNGSMVGKKEHKSLTIAMVSSYYGRKGSK